MTKLTNHTRGPRGVNLDDGTIVWLEPGETKDIDGKIVKPLPDLGKPADAAPADTGEIDELKAQVADLTKQVETLSKDKADLTKQVETLSKAK